MDKLTLYCGLQGDGAVYHAINAHSGSYAGACIAGPNRLLDTLELHLGLSGIYPTEQARMLLLKSRLDKLITPAFAYAAAYLADPLSVVKRLLHLWESWQLAGWQPADTENLPGRMKWMCTLKDALSNAGTGTAQRLQNLLAALRHHPCLPPMTIKLTDPQESFPYLYQQLFEKLDRYMHIQAAEVAPQAPAGTDLGTLQRLITGENKAPEGQSFKNDGSLQILHFPSDLQAANAVFAIRQATGWHPLIINADNGLLSGLHYCAGMPVCNWQTAAGNGQVSQLFFLATAMFLRPVKPSQILAFLSSPFTPFSTTLAARLMEVFSEKPGIGNESWNLEIAQYLSSLKGEPQEETRKKRIDFWLKNNRCLTEPLLNTSFLTEIYQTLDAWALYVAEEANSMGSYKDQLINLSTLCQHLVTALKDEGEHIDEARFERLQSQLFRDVPAIILEAEASSCHLVAAPGAVWERAKEILWMNATRIEGTDCLTAYWYQEEKDWFRAKGLPIHDESHAFSNYRQGVNRMALLAAKRLVMIVPSKRNGACAYKPYCLDEWNQLISLKPVTSTVTGLLQAVPWKPEKQLTATYSAIALPKHEVYLKIPKGAYARDCESHASLDKLFQHPATWFLEYVLKLKYKGGITLPGISALKGTVAKTVFQNVFRTEHKAAGWWADGALFQREVQKHLEATLLEKGLPFLERKAKRFSGEYEKVLLHAAASLKAIIDLNGFNIAGTQVAIKGSLNSQPVEGCIDLLLEKEGKKFVVDLNWPGNCTVYLDRLKNGTDLQLALCASLTSDVVRCGYFMLRDAKLLVRKEGAQRELKGQALQYIPAAPGVTTAAVIRKAENSLVYRIGELNRGRAEAAYHIPLEDISYYHHQDLQNLYPLREEKAIEKQPPLTTDYDLFFGKIC